MQRAAAIAIMLLIAPLSFAKINFDSLDWEKQIVRDNLTVMTAAVPGQSIKAFRAVSTYNTSIAKLIATITDMEHFTDWVEGAKQVKIVKQMNDRTQAAHYVNDFPFPAKDRDWVFIQSIRIVSEDKVQIQVGTANELMPEKSEYKRVEQAEGAWILEKVDADKVKLTYQMHVNPAGSLPSWMVNMMLTESPKKTLMQLHNVDFGRYQNMEKTKLYISAQR